MRIVLFTDTIGDLNGVSRFIQDMGTQANRNGHDLQIITSTRKYCPPLPNIHNFKPAFHFAMPYYPELDIALPPRKKIREHVRRLDPDVIHVSTPGALGIFGRKLALELEVPMLGTYHTDFPAYILDNTGSKVLKRMADKKIGRFYEGFRFMFTRSDAYTDIIAQDIGFPHHLIHFLKPGTDIETFTHRGREEGTWRRLFPEIEEGTLKVLYVGRISKEKNVPFLLESWKRFKKEYEEQKAQLVMIGEGVLRKRTKEMKAFDAHMVGPVVGPDLAKVYAEADLFVFPSVTDTLGQVVMEAQASRVPVIVSHIGGPKTLVGMRGESGLVVPVDDPDRWAKAIAGLLYDPERRKKMGKNGRKAMETLPIADSYHDFYERHQHIYSQVELEDED